MPSVKTECRSCGGTGLYSGMCEGPGCAVICLDCDGSGCCTVEYKEYKGRKRKRGIHSIQASRGRLIIGPMGGGGPLLTYEAFEQAIPAPRYTDGR